SRCRSGPASRRGSPSCRRTRGSRARPPPPPAARFRSASSRPCDLLAVLFSRRAPRSREQLLRVHATSSLCYSPDVLRALESSVVAALAILLLTASKGPPLPYLPEDTAPGAPPREGETWIYATEAAA